MNRIIHFPTDIFGWTPLHIAMDKCNVDVADFLVKNGADTNAKSIVLTLNSLFFFLLWENPIPNCRKLGIK